MISSRHFLCLDGRDDEPRAIHLAEGQTCLHCPSATFLREGRGGQLQVILPGAATFRIASGARVAQRRSRTDGARVSQWLKFAEGGECLATFDSAGDLEQLEGTRVSITCAAGELIVGPLPAVGGDAVCRD
jgi:hypothetical protein